MLVGYFLKLLEYEISEEVKKPFKWVAGNASSDTRGNISFLILLMLCGCFK